MSSLKGQLPRLFNLDLDKQVTVQVKKEQGSFLDSFCRPLRGAKSLQWEGFLELLCLVSLLSACDRWVWSLLGVGEFSVASARSYNDEKSLLTSMSSTMWCNLVLIKVDVFVWSVSLDRFPTR